MSTKFKHNNIIIEDEFADLFSFKNNEDALQHSAEVISFKILSEVERICEERKIKRSELANFVGHSKSYITQLFNGSRQVNTMIMAKFENALDITFEINAINACECRYNLLVKDISKEKLTKLRLSNKEYTCYFFKNFEEERTSDLVEKMKAEVDNPLKQVS